MKAIAILTVAAVVILLLTWLHESHPVRLVEFIPFVQRRRPSLYDPCAVLVLGIAAAGLWRLRGRPDDDDE